MTKADRLAKLTIKFHALVLVYASVWFSGFLWPGIHGLGLNTAMFSIHPFALEQSNGWPFQVL